MKRGLLTGLVALALLSAAPARADFSAFLNATCGPNCADPIGEQAAAQANWAAFQSMGTTQWIGATIGNTKIDASSLLGAARVAGASELDRWLNTGDAASGDVGEAMSLALQADAGLDVSLITGSAPTDAYQPGYGNAQGNYGTTFPSLGTGQSGSLGGGYGGGLGGSSLSQGLGTAASLTSSLGGGALGNALGTAAGLAGALTGGGVSGALGGGGGGYCAQNIDQMQNANAQRYVQAMQQIATSGDYGFSQNGGKPISSGSPSGSGYYKGGCLDQLMQGTRDMLFKPPGLSNLLSQLGGMFGGGGGSGGGGCGNTPSILSQLQKSMPSSIFQAGNGGFLPSAAFGGGGLNAGSALAALGVSRGISTPSLTQALGR